jgi:hypothetical protein
MKRPLLDVFFLLWAGYVGAVLLAYGLVTTLQLKRASGIRRDVFPCALHGN